jgi:hypothetical protein
MKSISTLRKPFILLFVTFFFISTIAAQELAEKIKQLPSVVSVKKIEHHSFFQEAYEVLISQNIDHKNPGLGKFNQRVVVSGYNPFSPVVLVTEGYHADYAISSTYINELSRILEANQIVAEHRYFGKSKPETNDWQYLTAENAATDLHVIKELFNNIYPNKWIATGISKGGQNTLAYKSFYPNDMHVWIAYVAPNNFAVEDRRHEKYIARTGTKELRDQVFAFQQKTLQNRGQLQPLLDSLFRAKGMQFQISENQILDYCVLEYPFSFWQWKSRNPDIPANSDDPQELFKHLVLVASPDYFDTNKMQDIRPFFIQAAKELGYYSYGTKPLKELLSIDNAKGYLGKLFLKQNESFKFNKNLSKLIEKTINTDGLHRR